jgi:predicted peptidase
MGGEAAYRFALNRPDMFAAIAPLSAYSSSSSMEPIRDLPVWAIHGADDIIVPLFRAQEPVEALKKIGGNVRFSVLEGHDHDVWTDTYLDPGFYDWLLQHQRP